MGDTLLGCLLVIAAYFDVKRRKIPNTLIVAGWLAGMVLRFGQEGTAGLAKCMIAAAATIVAGFPFFLIRVIGAGDIKLWSVISAMAGISFFLRVFSVAIPLAGIWSLAKLLKYHMLPERLSYAWTYFTAGIFRKHPYGTEGQNEAKLTVLLAPFTAIAYFILILFPKYYF